MVLPPNLTPAWLPVRITPGRLIWLPAQPDAGSPTVTGPVESRTFKPLVIWDPHIFTKLAPMVVMSPTTLELVMVSAPPAFTLIGPI